MNIVARGAGHVGGLKAAAPPQKSRLVAVNIERFVLFRNFQLQKVLERVTETIRERFELRRMIQTLTAQGRMSRWVVSGLPVVLLLDQQGRIEEIPDRQQRIEAVAKDYAANPRGDHSLVPTVAANLRAIAKRLNASLAIIDKRRERAGESEVMNIIGDVDGRTCILVDDIVDSAGTLCNAAAALKQQGAEEVFAYCTHGVLSGGAAARVAASELKELVVTDSIYSGEPDARDGPIRRLTIAPLLAEAVRRIADESSVSSLFD